MKAATPLPNPAVQRTYRPAALAFAVAVAFGVSFPQSPATAARPGSAPHSLSDVAAAAGSFGARGNAVAAIHSVANCDDAGPGSLRDAVAAAASGDTIDLTGLACSTITLTSGAIAVSQDYLTIEGPGRDALAIDGSSISQLFAHTGAGTLRLEQLTLRNGVIETQGSAARGGCVASSGGITIDQISVHTCTASGGMRAYGGCISATSFNAADSLVTGCTVELADDVPGLSAGGAVAVISSYEASSINRSVFKDNHVISRSGSALGGAVALIGDGPATIDSSTFDSNYAIGAAYVPAYGFFTIMQGMGGAIATGSTTTITGTTLLNNSASSGGAIAIIGDLDVDGLKIINSTISGNEASGTGGGVWSIGIGLRIESSTIAFNSATYGGGGIMPRHSNGGRTYDPPEFNSSIIASNSTGYYGTPDIFTNLVDLVITGSSNLIGSSNIQVPTDTISADPMLLPLGNNGGPTLTHMPMEDSPVIDVGSNKTGLTTDQRGDGYPRVVGDIADIGAVEFSQSLDLIFIGNFD